MCIIALGWTCYSKLTKKHATKEIILLPHNCDFLVPQYNKMHEPKKNHNLILPKEWVKNNLIMHISEDIGKPI